MSLNTIKFLQGSYEKLNSLTSSEAGAFYVTNDTHEMFLGLGENKAPVALNRWVDVEEKFSDIQAKTDYKQHPGKFYYAKKENILCTYDGEKWIQINPDTNDNTSLSKVEISDGTQEVDANGKKLIKYTLTFTEKNIDGDDLSNPITADLVITDEMVTSLVVNVQVDITASVSSNKATIKTTGAGSAGNGFVFEADTDTGLTLEKDASTGNVVIKGTTYELGVQENTTTIQLTNSDDDDCGTATIVGDNDWTDAKNTSGNIEVGHKEKTVSKPTAKKGTVSDDKKFIAVTGLTLDKNHVTGIETSEFTFPDSVYTLESTTETLKDKEYTTTISLVNEQGDKDTEEIKTAHTITIDGTEKVIENGGDFGAFYSKSAIDTKLKAVDAMVYKGTVSKESDLPTTNVQIGHTYKVNVKGTYNTKECDIGDLLIANGTETIGEDGNAYITSNLTWDHIQSGADADTTYVLSASNDTIALTDSVNEDTQTIALEDSEKIELTTTTTDNGDEAIVATHLGNKATQTTGEKTVGFGEEITVVTGITDDNTGHLTAVTSTKITLPSEDVVKVSDATNTFGIYTAEDDKKGSVSIVNDNNSPLTVSSEADGTDLTVTVMHDTATVGSGTDTNNTVKLTGENNTFTVVSSIENDGYGHLKTIKTKTVTIDKETTYSLTEPEVANNIASITLKDSNEEDNGKINLSSENLTYEVSEDNKNININFYWGSF